MKILFLSFYFQPDLCAGSFRNTALIEALKEKMPKGSRVDVITTLPNRYSSFSADAPLHEEEEELTIHRIALPAHHSGMADQSRAFYTFALGVVKLVRGQEYDVVYASSSRLMTAVLGAYIARKKCALLYLDIRDIFVDTITDVIPKKLALPLKPALSLIEKWAFKQANKINLVSEGFDDYFKSRYPASKFSYFPNGIDQEFLNLDFKQANLSRPKVLNILYAGNIGEGQGLHLILPELALMLKGQATFTVIGDGGRKLALEKALNLKAVKNISLIKPMSRKELIDAYQDADVLFMHLNHYQAFLKVLPSKIFEYAATGKPIWAGVSGFAANFLTKQVDNAAVFNPCNAEQAIEMLETLEIKTHKREAFISQYKRSVIMKEMASDIISIKS